MASHTTREERLRHLELLDARPGMTLLYGSCEPRARVVLDGITEAGMARIAFAEAIWGRELGDRKIVDPTMLIRNFESVEVYGPRQRGPRSEVTREWLVLLDGEVVCRKRTVANSVVVNGVPVYQGLSTTGSLGENGWAAKLY